MRERAGELDGGDLVVIPAVVAVPMQHHRVVEKKKVTALDLLAHVRIAHAASVDQR
jgi:hypothetical protein